MQLIFLLGSVFFAEAFWTCPNGTIGNGQKGNFPNDWFGADYQYTSGMNCTIDIGVPKGQYIQMNFNSYGTDPRDSFLVYDDTGTYFENNGTSLPPQDLLTATNVHIQITTQFTGKFAFHFNYGYVNMPLSNKSSFVSNEQGFLLEFKKMTYNSSAIIKSDSPVTIFGGFNGDTISSISSRTDLQYFLIYAGEGSDGRFLGSMYTLYTQQKPLIYDTPPYTVTVFQLYNAFDIGLLFRTTSSIQNLEYSFVWQGIANDDVFVSLNPTTKPSAVTIYNYDSQYFGLYALQTTGKVDWLPGGSLPPTRPTLSFYSPNNLNNVPQLTPGILNTFISNSSAKLSFARRWQKSGITLDDLSYGTLGYFPSQNYRIPTSQQYEYITLDTRDSFLTLTVLDSYNYFEVNGNRLPNGTTTLSNSSTYELKYNPANNFMDTGGFLSYVVGDPANPPPTKIASQNLLFLPIIVLFIKL